MPCPKFVKMTKTHIFFVLWHDFVAITMSQSMYITNGRMCTSRLKDHSSQIGKLSFISASTKTITLIVENSPVYQCLLADTNVSSSFFLSFFLTMIASSSTCLIGCLPNLVRSMCVCMATKLMGLKIHPGSYGVTRVKNVNHVKNMKTAPIQNLIMPSCRQ